jgi:quercetin dioxygenase-like cupin family protein
MLTQLHQKPAGPGVYVYDMAATPWSETGKAGVVQKAVRADPSSGDFLGLVRFEPMVSAGVHQHLGPATSLMLSGALADYQDSYGPETVTINLTGTTHDAISWQGCAFVARLEGPTIYLPDSQGAGHVGAAKGVFRNPAPERPAAIDFPLRTARVQTTSVSRVSRRMLFDYSLEKENHRYVELTLWPEAQVPTHRVSALTEWMVLAGGAKINNQNVPIGAIVVIEPGAEITIESPYGCRALVWANGPIEWADSEAPDLYGF